MSLEAFCGRQWLLVSERGASVLLHTSYKGCSQTESSQWLQPSSWLSSCSSSIHCDPPTLTE